MFTLFTEFFVQKYSWNYFLPPCWGGILFTRIGTFYKKHKLIILIRRLYGGLSWKGPPAGHYSAGFPKTIWQAIKYSLLFLVQTFQDFCSLFLADTNYLPYQDNKSFFFPCMAWIQPIIYKTFSAALMRL